MVKQNVKSNFIKVILLAIVILTVFTAVGCGAKAKTFETDAGLSITLTKGFSEKTQIGQTMYLESKNVIFCALKEEFSNLAIAGINEDTSLEEYASKVAKNNAITVEVVVEGDLTFFDYDKTYAGKDFFYRAYVFKGSDAFWLCQFACVKEDKNSQVKNFTKWANTITVK